MNDSDGLLIVWSLRLAEFDFDVKYITTKANKKADTFPQLKQMSRTIPHYDKVIMSGFVPVSTNIELRLNISPDEINLPHRRLLQRCGRVVRHDGQTLTTVEKLRTDLI